MTLVIQAVIGIVLIVVVLLILVYVPLHFVLSAAIPERWCRSRWSWWPEAFRREAERPGIRRAVRLVGCYFALGYLLEGIDLALGVPQKPVYLLFGLIHVILGTYFIFRPAVPLDMIPTFWRAFLEEELIAMLAFRGTHSLILILGVWLCLAALE